MGRRFRDEVTNATYQRTFHKDSLLQLLTEYAAAMGPERSEKRTIEEIKNKIIKCPELPRKMVLEFCAVRTLKERSKNKKRIFKPIMNRDMRRDFEDSMQMNKENPKYKKLLTNPADGSADQREHNHGKRQQRHFDNKKQHEQQQPQQQQQSKQSGPNNHRGNRGYHRGNLLVAANRNTNQN